MAGAEVVSARGLISQGEQNSKGVRERGLNSGCCQGCLGTTVVLYVGS